jgi:guanidinopropionase
MRERCETTLSTVDLSTTEKGLDVDEASNQRPSELAHPDSMVAAPFVGSPTLLRTPYHPELEGLDIALVGVPYDGGSTFRPGARYGPQAVRLASTMIRPFHPVLRISPHDVCRIADVGDVPFERMLDPAAAANEISAFYDRLRDFDVTPLSIGGDHSIPYPILRAIVRDGPVGLVHFDAHCDTWPEYQGTRFHNGAWVRWSIEEGYVDPQRAIQIGIRGQQSTLEGWEYAERCGVRLLTMAELDDVGVDAALTEMRKRVGTGPVYVSFDVDVLDPVYAGGTDTPEPGGLTMREAQRFIRGLSNLVIIGADVVEIAPLLDPSGRTAHSAATIAYELVSVIAAQYGDGECRERSRRLRSES